MDSDDVMSLEYSLLLICLPFQFNPFNCPLNCPMHTATQTHDDQKHIKVPDAPSAVAIVFFSSLHHQTQHFLRSLLSLLLRLTLQAS